MYYDDHDLNSGLTFCCYQASPFVGKSYMSVAWNTFATVAVKTYGVCEIYVPYKRRYELSYFMYKPDWANKLSKLIKIQK